MSVKTDFAFLHGGGQGGWVWRQTIEALKLQTRDAFGRALALDAPGCGAKRGRSDSDFGAAEIAAELIGEIEAAGFHDVLLVGHSKAGEVLPFMLEQRPSLFKRVVYVTCLAPPPGRPGIALFGSGLRGQIEGEIGWPADPATSDRRAFFSAMFCNDMSDEEAAPFLDQLGYDMWPDRTMSECGWRYDHLGAVPATYVLCLRDQALPPAWQESFAERFKAERVVRIDAGHQVMNSRPCALAEVLRHEAG